MEKCAPSARSNRFYFNSDRKGLENKGQEQQSCDVVATTVPLMEVEVRLTVEECQILRQILDDYADPDCWFDDAERELYCSLVAKLEKCVVSHVFGDTLTS